MTIVVKRKVSGPRTDRGWRALIGSLMIVLPLGIDLFLPSLPAVAAGLDADITTVQLTMTAYLLGVAIGQFIAGPVSDAVGRRPPILVGLVLSTVSTTAGAFAPTVELLIVARVGAGLGAGALFVIASGIIRDHYDGIETPRAFSRAAVVVTTSVMIGPVIGASLLRYFGWRGILGFSALISLCILVVVARKLPETLARQVHQSRWAGRLRDDASALVRDRDFIGYAMAVILSIGGMWALLGGSAFVLQQQFEVTPLQYGIILGIMGVGLVAVTQFSAQRVHIYGARLLMIGGVLMMLSGAIILVIAAILGSSLPVFLVGFFLFTSSTGLIGPLGRALAAQHHEVRAGSAYAIVGAGMFTCGALAVPLSGLLPMNQLSATATVTSLLALAAASGILVTRRGSARIHGD